MKADYRRSLGAIAALLTVLLAPHTAVARDAVCDVRLTVELDPDVPDARSDGFLSSLLNRHFNYRLELLRQDDQDPAVLEVELRGPGPQYRCQQVIETMRRDARVQSIRIQSASLASE